MIGRHDFVDQSPLRCLAGVDPLAGQHQALCHPDAKGLDEVGADHRGHQSELHFAQAEERLVRGDRDVTAGHQADTAANRSSLHPGDRWLGQRVQEAEHFDEAARVTQVLLNASRPHAAHRAEIRAGTEARAGRGEFDNPNIRVGSDRAQVPGELVNSPGVERVARLGPVQRDRRDTAAPVQACSSRLHRPRSYRKSEEPEPAGHRQEQFEPGCRPIGSRAASRSDGRPIADPRFRIRRLLSKPSPCDGTAPSRTCRQ